MKWLRSNIQHGSRLALLAMAIQLLLSFGHFHGLTVDAASANSGKVASITSPDVSSRHPPDRSRADQVIVDADHSSPSLPHSGGEGPDSCAICAVIAQANATALTALPLLLPPVATDLPFGIADVDFIHLNSTPNAFQPRAPPLS